MEQPETKAKPDREDCRVETDSGKERDPCHCSKERKSLHSLIIFIYRGVPGSTNHSNRSRLFVPSTNPPRTCPHLHNGLDGLRRTRSFRAANVKTNKERENGYETKQFRQMAW